MHNGRTLFHIFDGGTVINCVKILLAHTYLSCDVVGPDILFMNVDTPSPHLTAKVFNIPVMGGRGGLVVRSRLWGRRAPGSKPDSTEDLPCMGPVAR
ncbi:hypothetical protein AVEN_56125-1 [Araneus ventricosus]|uniref:Uncharacterized protein n=1 Tax=Araneus ventricosus TaxID=182803 RepID=A0A4Y2QXU2_ARAVE|nr:hypothetical protein AVEN_238774-1 [Araneus ventricosus]GBN68235.1 hypothetical protein AVEN_56125-1 [Araneus ventricosus]